MSLKGFMSFFVREFYSAYLKIKKQEAKLLNLSVKKQRILLQWGQLRKKHQEGEMDGERRSVQGLAAPEQIPSRTVAFTSVPHWLRTHSLSVALSFKPLDLALVCNGFWWEKKEEKEARGKHKPFLPYSWFRLDWSLPVSEFLSILS